MLHKDQQEINHSNIILTLFRLGGGGGGVSIFIPSPLFQL